VNVPFSGGPGDEEGAPDEESSSWVSESGAPDSGLFNSASDDEEETPSSSSWVEEEAEATPAAAAAEPAPEPKPAPRPASTPVDKGKMKVSALDDLFSRAKNLKKKS
jgi:hypothetical protein